VITNIEELIAYSDRFLIKQKKEWLEILTQFETRNRYEIFDGQKNLLGNIEEEGKGLWHFLKRIFLRSHRPLKIQIRSLENVVLLSLHRPFFWFFSDLYVEYNGKKFGSIHRRFNLIHKNYILLDTYQREIFTIKSPFWRLWRFPIFQRSEQVGTITKKWQGLLKEVFTDADAFMIEFTKSDISLEEKVLIFVAGIAIDFDFFENNHNN
jgi:hypothetical protein